MNVRDVLNGRHGVHSCVAEEPLSRAIDVLDDAGVRALVVLHADGGPAGILSVRDVVRALRADGSTALTNPVSTYMSDEIVTVGPQHALERVDEMVSGRSIHHVPVVEDNKVVGVITTADLLASRLRSEQVVAQDLLDFIHWYR